MNKQTVLTIIITITIIFSQYHFSYSQGGNGSLQQQLECVSSSTGFDEEAYHNNGKRFPKSDYSRDLTQLRKLIRAHETEQGVSIKIIDINDSGGCEGWGDCGLNSKEYDYFFIVPGDYRAWGPLKIRASGGFEKNRIITYYNPNAGNPYKPRLPLNEAMHPGKHVILEALDVSDADHWIFNGLTFSGNSATDNSGKKGGVYSRIGAYSEYNIVNYCLFENVAKGPNFYITHSNYNTLQNSVVRNQIGTDWVGILISGENSVALGNRIVNNEIYDCNDGIHLNYRYQWGQNGDLSGTIIENNDIYLTSKAYSDKAGFSCAENAIDIKTGGKTNKVDDVVMIIKNRIWGYRPSDTSCGPSGSNGDGITIHQRARNILIKDNVFFDLPSAISISHKNDRNTNVAVINNVFHRIKKYNEASSGIAINSATHCDIYYNVISKAAAPILAQAKSDCRIQCNTIIKSPQKFNWTTDKKGSSILNAWYNCDVEEGDVYSNKPERNIVDNNADLNNFGDFTFYIQRWTGPEKVTFRGLFAENHSQVALIASPQIHCGENYGGQRWWMKIVANQLLIK